MILHPTFAAMIEKTAKPASGGNGHNPPPVHSALGAEPEPRKDDGLLISDPWLAACVVHCPARRQRDA